MWIHFNILISLQGIKIINLSKKDPVKLQVGEKRSPSMEDRHSFSVAAHTEAYIT